MLEVGHHHVQQVVHVAGERVAGHHLVPAAHGLGEARHAGAAVLLQLHAHEGLQAEADRSRVDARRVAADRAGLFQALQAAQAGGGRQVHPLGEFGIGQAPFALQGGEDAAVGAVPRRRWHDIAPDLISTQ